MTPFTPFDTARGLAEFLKERLEKNEERIGADGSQCSAWNVYAGFLPKAQTADEMKKLCPAVVLRPDTVTDQEEQSTVSIAAFVVVYDKDLRQGCASLYHLLEFIREQLLACNPVADRYWIQPGMTATVPDKQPYPQWIGVIEFEVAIPQIKSTSGPLKEWTR